MSLAFLGRDVSSKAFWQRISFQIFFGRYSSSVIFCSFFCWIFSLNNFGRGFSSGFLVANFVSKNLLDFPCRDILVSVSPYIEQLWWRCLSRDFGKGFFLEILWWRFLFRFLVGDFSSEFFWQRFPSEILW